jgi:hypothetical protein
MNFNKYHDRAEQTFKKECSNAKGLAKIAGIIAITLAPIVAGYNHDKAADLIREANEYTNSRIESRQTYQTNDEEFKLNNLGR